MAIDQSFIDEYHNLLILQYSDKPKAKAEISTIAGQFSRVYGFLYSFYDSFDLDKATGNQLDIIGAIVGLSRIVPLIIPKNYFGFSDNPNSYGFADRFDSTLVTYPFKDRQEIPYTDTQLNDNDYRFFIKVKVANNVVSAYMVYDDKISIQDVINTAFGGKAYVIDNKDMSMNLYLDYSIGLNTFDYLQKLDLLPKPQGVRYRNIVQFFADETFGFSDNPASLGFGDRFDSSVIGGKFASKVI